MIIRVSNPFPPTAADLLAAYNNGYNQFPIDHPPHPKPYFYLCNMTSFVGTFQLLDASGNVLNSYNLTNYQDEHNRYVLFDIDDYPLLRTGRLQLIGYDGSKLWQIYNRQFANTNDPQNPVVIKASGDADYTAPVGTYQNDFGFNDPGFNEVDDYSNYTFIQTSLYAPDPPIFYQISNLTNDNWNVIKDGALQVLAPGDTVKFLQSDIAVSVLLQNTVNVMYRHVYMFPNGTYGKHQLDCTTGTVSQSILHNDLNGGSSVEILLPDGAFS